MELKNINIGEIIKEISKQKINNDAEFARKLGMKPQNLTRNVYKKNSIDTALLCEISSILDYNFFKLYVSDDAIKKDDKIRYTVKVEMELTEEEILRLGLKNKILTN